MLSALEKNVEGGGWNTKQGRTDSDRRPGDCLTTPCAVPERIIGNHRLERSSAMSLFPTNRRKIEISKGTHDPWTG